MNDSLHSYMKVGIVHPMAFPSTAQGGGPIVEKVGQIAEDAFFGSIELTSIPDSATRQTVARILQTSGLIVVFSAQSIELGNKLDLNSLDEATRAKAVGRMKEAIDEGYEIGARRFAVLSGPDPGEAQRKAATEALVDSLNQLCAYAAGKGHMGVVLEVFDRTIDKKSLVGPSTEAAALARAVRVRHPSFGLMIDLSHLPLQFETPQESFAAAGDCLVHAHIGNCVLKDRSHPLYGDLHPRFDVPGGENGVPQVVDFLRELLSIGYIGEGRQNVVAFEVKPFGDETSEVVVANAKRTLMEAWARL